MADSLRGSRSIQALKEDQHKWLAAFDPQYLKNWEKLLNNNEEAAFAEARVRVLLQDNGITVEPNECLTGERRSPDFRCHTSRSEFYVEVSCTSEETAARKTNAPVHLQQGELHWVKPLTDTVFEKCHSKTTQCSDLNAPVLLAIGTFHVWAGIVDNKFDAFWLRNSQPFLRPDNNQKSGYARCPFSGLLACSLRSDPIRVRGILHPNPVRSFDPDILPGVEFAQVIIDRVSRQPSLVWPEDADE
jgi:hypothetical protein